MPSSTETAPLFIERGQYRGKSVAVLTSGGDAQGMNAALLAIVRFAVYVGCKIYFIKNGYQGLVDGGENIQEAEWSSVSNIIQLSGTIIGASCSMEFVQRDGRMKAAYNLIKNGISRLIVIGGDGTLIGASIFYQDWPTIIYDLWNHGRIDSFEADAYANLHLVGMVASIDNDFCRSDVALGSDSANHRALEVCDAFRAVPNCQARTLILEVMGEKSGYLALLTSVCAGADYVFIPESPPKPDWPQKLTKRLSQAGAIGQKSNIIILAEGAIDRTGQKIAAEQVRAVVADATHHDVRITVLGHLQRGGSPSSFDRITGCRMGTESILAALESTDETEPCVISMLGNQTTRSSLLDEVECTRTTIQAMADQNWELCVQLRSTWFQWLLQTHTTLSRIDLELGAGDRPGPFRFAVMHIGTLACGMNTAVRCFVKKCIACGHIVYGVNDGIEGLATGKIKQLEWNDVRDWIGKPGAILGVKPTLPNGKLEEIAKHLQIFRIQGVYVVGGFEAVQAVNELLQHRKHYPEFCIPFIILPSTTSNNVPGTDYSMGCDSGLNRVTEICDRIVQSAIGPKKLVYIIETMGGYCGYLTTMAALASNADAAYIHEEKVKLKTLQEDARHMDKKMEKDFGYGLILRNEHSSKHYNTDFIHRLHSEEGKALYSCQQSILGNLQEGGTPSAIDRIIATIFTMRSYEWLVNHCKKSTKRDSSVYSTEALSACVIGIIGQDFVFTPITDILNQAYVDMKRPRKQWWLKLKPLIKILARPESTYDEEGNSAHSVEQRRNCKLRKWVKII